jgi:hypothetical protein
MLKTYLESNAIVFGKYWLQSEAGTHYQSRFAEGGALDTYH